jgi:hypothetical protein
MTNGEASRRKSMKQRRGAGGWGFTAAPIHWQSVLPLAALCLLAVPLVIGCASSPAARGGAEPLFGTWVDQELMGSQLEYKFIYQSDGKSFGWNSGTPPEQPNNSEGRFTIEKKWIDSQGNTWYRVAGASCLVPYMESKVIKEYGLVKVHSDGMILEGEWSTVDFPSEFGALGNYHYIYHREE